MGSKLHRIGIVADDLTGAGDCAVQFAQNGWYTELSLAGDLSSRPRTAPAREAFALVTDARAMPDSAARSATSSAVTKLEAMKIDRLFIKIDSTGRGSLTGQIEGALASWHAANHDPVAVVCPTYPLLGRTLESGHILVHGVSVENTAAGRDPITPLASASITDLIPGSVNISIDGGIASALFRTINEQIEVGFRVISVNAASDVDLDVIAEVVERLGPWAIPVGSAGLAKSLARRWADTVGSARKQALPAVGHVVVVISSLHDISRDQHKHLLDNVAPNLVVSYAPSVSDLLSSATTKTWIDANLSRVRKRVSVVISPAARGTELDSPSLIASGLAHITQAIVSGDRDTTLLLIGGEGARAVLLELGATTVSITGSLQEGIPVGTVGGGRLSGVTVVTKAGGFGDTKTVTALLPQLLGEESAISLNEGAQS